MKSIRIIIITNVVIVIGVALTYFVPVFISKDDIILFNNSSSTINICAREQHHSICKVIESNDSGLFNMERTKLFTINENKHIYLKKEMLKPSMVSSVYCNKYKCMHALQLEENDMLYILKPEQFFIGKDISEQPESFPLRLM